jgi:hypothetical protein
MIISYRLRGPSIDASYQVSDHLVKRFQRRRFFFNWPIRNNNCLWRPCLLTDWDEISNMYREPSIDISYQVSVHLAKGFQRRRLKCEKLTDDGRQVMAKAQIALILFQSCVRCIVILILATDTSRTRGELGSHPKNFIGWGGGYSVAFISSATYAIVFNFNLNNNLTRGATNYIFPPPNYGLSKAVIHSSYTCNDFAPCGPSIGQ